jgi:hypothetical protein
MLRPAITPNRTEVQVKSEMKQPTTRQLLPTPTASGRSHTYLPTLKICRQLSNDVRLFKV